MCGHRSGARSRPELPNEADNKVSKAGVVIVSHRQTHGTDDGTQSDEWHTVKALCEHALKLVCSNECTS